VEDQKIGSFDAAPRAEVGRGTDFLHKATVGAE
jgi:hypothetical protein